MQKKVGNKFKKVKKGSLSFPSFFLSSVHLAAVAAAAVAAAAAASLP